MYGDQSSYDVIPITISRTYNIHMDHMFNDVNVNVIEGCETWTMAYHGACHIQNVP